MTNTHESAHLTKIVLGLVSRHSLPRVFLNGKSATNFVAVRHAPPRKIGSRKNGLRINDSKATVSSFVAWLIVFSSLLGT